MVAASETPGQAGRGRPCSVVDVSWRQQADQSMCLRPGQGLQSSIIQQGLRRGRSLSSCWQGHAQEKAVCTLMLSVARGELGVKSSSDLRNSPGGRGLLLLGGSSRRGLGGGGLGGGRRDTCCILSRTVTAGRGGGGATL